MKRRIRLSIALVLSAVVSLITLMLPGSIVGAQGRNGRWPARPNVLIIIADDMGVGEVGIYGPRVTNSSPGLTPVLDTLALGGVRFNQAWSNPVCSPTRATILTGRYSLHTGIGTAIGNDIPSGDAELLTNEFTMAESFHSIGYQTALIGKWHLGVSTPGVGFNAPNTIGGFDYYSGGPKGDLDSFTAWDWYQNGVFQGEETTYATTKNVDDAIAFINGVRDDPWLMVLAFNAPHKPLHVPPSGLLSTGTNRSLSGLKDSNCQEENTYARLCYQASIEAMDTEIGRLFRQTGFDDEDTLVIFVGDNGTDGDALPVPVAGIPFFDPNRAKGTVYQGGVRVPLIISGLTVVDRGREINDPVNTTDLFGTVAAIVGAPLPIGTDWRTLGPYLQNRRHPRARRFVYTERFSGTDPHDTTNPATEDSAAFSDGVYKVIEKDGALTDCYYLVTDEYELTNLLEIANPPQECNDLWVSLEAGPHAGL